MRKQIYSTHISQETENYAMRRKSFFFYEEELWKECSRTDHQASLLQKPAPFQYPQRDTSTFLGAGPHWEHWYTLEFTGAPVKAL